MDALYWFYRSAGGAEFGGEESCWLCGRPCGQDFHWRAVVRDTFNDFNLARSPASEFLCFACEHYFNHKPERRKSAWLLRRSGDLYTALLLERTELRGVLLAFPPPVESILLCPTSKKKHIALQARTSFPEGRGWWAQFELTPLWVDELFVALLGDFEAMRELGFPKGSIIANNYSHKALRKCKDLSEFERLRSRLAGWKDSLPIRLASYVAKGEEKKDDDSGEGDDAD